MKLFYLLVLIGVAKATPYDANTRFADANIGDEFAFRFSSVRDSELLTAHASLGVAISENIGLVTAQAVYSFDLFYMRYGSIHVAEQEIQSIDRNNIKVHPDYYPETLHHNIAVIKFTTPVTHYIEVATEPAPFPVLFIIAYGVSDVTLQQMGLLLAFEPSECEAFYLDLDWNGRLCSTGTPATILTDGDHGGSMVDFNRNFVYGLSTKWINEVNMVVGVDLVFYKTFITTSIAEFMLNFSKDIINK